MKQYAAPNQMQLDGSTQQETVIRNAIDRVRLAHDAAKGEKLYVAFSGGKDSTVLYDVVKKAAEKDKTPISEYCDLVYNVTGVDPPELVYFMRRAYPELQWSMYEKSMWRLIEAKGVPTQIQRFCCASLKERGGMGRMCCTGVRWAESVRRAKTRGAFETFPYKNKNKILLNDNDEARMMFETCMQKQKRVCNPIIDFTYSNIWDYIHGNGLPYCELYDQGFERLGCVGCPMAGNKRIRDFERWPKFKAAYIRAFDRYLIRRVEKGNPLTTWQTGQDVFDWWMQDKNMDKQIPGQIEWEDL